MHYSVHCRLFHWFLGKCFLVELSASLHVLFLHFLAKCFICNLFWGIFLRGGSKCKCAWWMVLEWKAFENDACSMFRFILQSASERPSPACAWGRSLVRVSYVTGT